MERRYFLIIAGVLLVVLVLSQQQRPYAGALYGRATQDSDVDAEMSDFDVVDAQYEGGDGDALQPGPQGFAPQQQLPQQLLPLPSNTLLRANLPPPSTLPPAIAPILVAQGFTSDSRLSSWRTQGGQSTEYFIIYHPLTMNIFQSLGLGSQAAGGSGYHNVPYPQSVGARDRSKATFGDQVITDGFYNAYPIPPQFRGYWARKTGPDGILGTFDDVVTLAVAPSPAMTTFPGIGLDIVPNNLAYFTWDQTINSYRVTIQHPGPNGVYETGAAPIPVPPSDDVWEFSAPITFPGLPTGRVHTTIPKLTTVEAFSQGYIDRLTYLFGPGADGTFGTGNDDQTHVLGGNGISVRLNDISYNGRFLVTLQYITSNPPISLSVGVYDLGASGLGGLIPSPFPQPLPITLEAPVPNTVVSHVIDVAVDGPFVDQVTSQRREGAIAILYVANLTDAQGNPTSQQATTVVKYITPGQNGRFENGNDDEVTRYSFISYVRGTTINDGVFSMDLKEKYVLLDARINGQSGVYFMNMGRYG